ncbi:MAG: fused MFS/spermidine synthase, partial [Elusimicrobiota bacterium]
MRAARETLTGLIVLLSNAVIMSVEMLAARMLFPHYGNTVFTWSAVITIIIAGLFLGYMIGGV